MTPRLACFRGQAQISTWLTTIVRNCALMQLRKPPRQIHVPLDEQFGEEQPRSLWEGLADERPSPEEEFRKCELTARLRKCTALLSPAVRRISGVLGDPGCCSSSHLSRSRTRVQHGIGEPDKLDYYVLRLTCMSPINLGS